MIQLCALDINFHEKMINLIQPYKIIQQNGDHLSFYKYCVKCFIFIGLFSLEHHVLPGLPAGRHVVTSYMYNIYCRIESN